MKNILIILFKKIKNKQNSIVNNLYIIQFVFLKLQQIQYLVPQEIDILGLTVIFLK